MPKNMLFSLKNCKNRQMLGALPSDSLASGCWGLLPQTPTSVILLCKFFSLHLPTRSDSFGELIKRPYMFLYLWRECTMISA